MPRSPSASPRTSRSPSPWALQGPTGATPLTGPTKEEDPTEARKDGRRSGTPAAGAPVRAGARDILPLHAQVRAGLYAGVDHITFRGTLTALLSGSLKLAVSAVAGRDAPLRSAVWLGAGGSGLQAVLGACLPGDREHGFSWVSTLSPHPVLEPPPTVAQWHLLGGEKDQRLLQVRLAPVSSAHDQTRLAALQSMLKRSLIAERDFSDFCSAVIAAGLMLFDGVVAAQARQSAEEGQIGRGSYQAILMLTALSLLLDFFACRWQVASRRPDPATYPKPAGPPEPALLMSPRPEAAIEMTPRAAAARREAWGETPPSPSQASTPVVHYVRVDEGSSADEDSAAEGLSEAMFRTRAAHGAAD